MKKIRVLVADDNELTNQILCEMIRRDVELELVGHAADGEDTIRLIHQVNPDVLLLDLIMPNMDGLDVLDSMKAEHRELAVIVVSALDDKSMIDRAFSKGADYYMRKPVSADSIRKKIRQVYEEKVARNAGKDGYGVSAYGRLRRNESAIEEAPENRRAELNREKAVTEELYRLGMPVNLIGYQYLRQAILILLYYPAATGDVSHEVYGRIAAASSASPASVERAMRNAIKNTFERGNQMRIHQLFDQTGEGTVRKPSVSVFITVIADSLRYA